MPRFANLAYVSLLVVSVFDRSSFPVTDIFDDNVLHSMTIYYDGMQTLRNEIYLLLKYFAGPPSGCLLQVVRRQKVVTSYGRFTTCGHSHLGQSPPRKHHSCSWRVFMALKVVRTVNFSPSILV